MVVEQNLEILTQELFTRVPTYQNGAPNTIIGPPTTGAHVLNEIWKDSKLALWICTVAGTPGTWLQLTPAVVSADPNSGSIPVGYRVLRSDQNSIEKFHAGGYVWREQIGSRSLTLLDAVNVILGTGTGTQLGTSTAQRLSFWGAAPVAQPAGANQAAVTIANADGTIGGLSFSNPPTQAECQTLRDKCEELADDLRNLSTLVHALRSALLEPVMNFCGEKSVQSKYIPALRLGCRHDEQVIRVMSAMKSGSSVLRI